MAINKNHEFEELDGVKCAIVEKNISKERAGFVKQLLEFNKYTVVVVAAAPPKPVAAARPAARPAAATTPTEGSTTTATPAAIETPAVKATVVETPVPAPIDTPAAEAPVVEQPLPPALFTVGVTDVTFNPINAIFGRLLKTPGGRIVTLAYWQQKEAISNDQVPYFAKK